MRWRDTSRQCIVLKKTLHKKISTYRNWRFTKFPISEGIEPDNWLLERELLIIPNGTYSPVRFVNWPIEEGMDPDNKFFGRELMIISIGTYRIVMFFKFPIDVGIGPDNWL